MSLLPQLPTLDGFIVKDVLLIGAGAVLLKFDLRRQLNTAQASATGSAASLTTGR